MISLSSGMFLTSIIKPSASLMAWVIVDDGGRALQRMRGSCTRGGIGAVFLVALALVMIKNLQRGVDNSLGCNELMLFLPTSVCNVTYTSSDVTQARVDTAELLVSTQCAGVKRTNVDT